MDEKNYDINSECNYQYLCKI